MGEEARQFPIDAVKTSNVKKPRSGKGKGQPRQITCPRCGKRPYHDKEACPAKGIICRKCGNKGHFYQLCKSASVSIVQEPIKQQEQNIFLGVVMDNSEQWTIPLVCASILYDDNSVAS